MNWPRPGVAGAIPRICAAALRLVANPVAVPWDAAAGNAG